jgi:hypothetical protein
MAEYVESGTGSDGLFDIVAREEAGYPVHDTLPPAVVILLQHVDGVPLLQQHSVSQRKKNSFRRFTGARIRFSYKFSEPVSEFRPFTRHQPPPPPHRIKF